MVKVEQTQFSTAKNMEFESVGDLDRHKKDHRTPTQKFECDECKRCFDEEWKMSAHLKSHKKYACNQCDKTFKWEDVLKKHVRISHENVKLFCHYFNNGLECPYNDECIFLHQDSEVCKYGAMCERNNCMYKHEEENDDEENGDEENSDEEIGDEENTEENNVDVDHGNRTFMNPFLSNSKESVVEEKDIEDNSEVKSTVNEQTVEESFKCKLCIFQTTDSKRFKRHQFENHSVKGKYLCIACHEEFESRKQFNSHNYHGCSPTLTLKK